MAHSEFGRPADATATAVRQSSRDNTVRIPLFNWPPVKAKISLIAKFRCRYWFALTQSPQF
jgi:hypothetical protein